jgi:hypothetical protein
MTRVWVLTAALCLSVCACAPATGIAIMSSSAGAATGAGIERSMSGRAHKTFIEPMADVETAAREVIERMSLTLEKIEDNKDGRTFEARAESRKIEIALERLTPTTTRLSARAKAHNALFPDDATATEIIMQIAKALEDSKTSERAIR